jgi:hypothetical protein
MAITTLKNAAMLINSFAMVHPNPRTTAYVSPISVDRKADPAVVLQ